MDIKKTNDKFTNPLTGKLVFDSIKPLNLNSFTKEDLREYFNNSFDLYETLFTSLKYDSVYYLCPDRLRLPLIFYYGHTAAVFMNKLCLAGLIKPNERIRFDLEMTFETGVDEMSWDDTEHYRMGGSYKWPTVEETKEFRLKVRELINKVIDRTPLELPVTWDSPWWALFMGFEHERIHFETSTVLIRQYPIELVQRPIGWTYAPFKLSSFKSIKENKMIKVPETNVRLGKSFDFPSYGWDNEYGQVDCKVSAFEASQFKITNEQFLEFVLDDGYKNRDYWSEEGWEWVQFKKATHPLFWVCPMKCKSGCGGVLSSYSHCQQHHFTKDQVELFNSSDSKEKMKKFFDDKNQNDLVRKFPFKYRLMFNIVEMPQNWPVEVNYHEAKAFCKWKGAGYRCITEAEHHAIRDYDVLDLNTSNDIIYQLHSKVNHNMAYGSSAPVDLHPANSKGFHDVFGNVWEWTEDNFNGLPGTKTHYLYDDFSSPCYDGRHNIIMGGSWASTGDEASCFARFMFRRHFYQHCGFRIVRSLPTLDGSKPNPQVRLVKDHIFVLGAGIPENKVDLNSNEIELSYYDTTNEQYFYDSHMHPEYFENELIEQHSDQECLQVSKLVNTIDSILDENKIDRKIATHLGCSTGRLVYNLVDKFDEVIGVDYCGRLLDVALKLQSLGKIDINLETKNDSKMTIKVENFQKIKKVVFKQMTWVPNEIPKSDLVIFTMIDRVENHLSWLRRLKEVVKPDGLLVIYSKESKWNSERLDIIISNVFELYNERSIDGKDSLTLWRIKSKYTKENL
ncbi:unnamed protein product [Brachionus calyciflorus]|uniref:Sulfatase-modifying factor enzyme-like domain-containing protein n=1 Tax=Brachionus calyciflorus TaxID=104777 RepID=A0A813RBY2_9BILA|nr:unnamed protein product [Brachionus calyciflorus]